MAFVGKISKNLPDAMQREISAETRLRKRKSATCRARPWSPAPGLSPSSSRGRWPFLGKRNVILAEGEKSPQVI
jgi:hypothetical protein